MWDLLWDSGRSWSVFSLGGGAFNSLRMEKGYRMWGADFHTDYNPWEAGSGWAVKLEKRDFVGRNTLVDLAYRCSETQTYMPDSEFAKRRGVGERTGHQR